MLRIEGSGGHRTGQMGIAHSSVSVTETAGFSCTDTLAAVPEQPVTTSAAASMNASIRSRRARLYPIVDLLDLRV